MKLKDNKLCRSKVCLLSALLGLFCLLPFNHLAFAQMDLNSLSLEEKKPDKPEPTKANLFDYIIKNGTIDSYFRSVKRPDSIDIGYDEDVFFPILKSSYNASFSNCERSYGRGIESNIFPLIKIAVEDCNSYYEQKQSNQNADGTQAHMVQMLGYIKKSLGEKGCKEQMQNIMSFMNDVNKAFAEKYGQTDKQLEKKRKKEAEQAKLAAIKKAEEQKKQEEHIKLLKQGKVPIKTIEEATIYHNAVVDLSIITNPPLKADNKNYGIVGIIEGKRGSLYQAQLQGFNFFFENNAREYKNHVFRVGEQIAAVGKFIDIQTATRVDGRDVYVPVFKILYLEE